MAMRRMAKRGRTIKARIVDDAGGRHDLQHLYDAYVKYIELSRYLFGSKEPIYDINEMPGDSGFFADAVRIAEQLGISWEAMTHEESNRIMLALLEDYYVAMSKVVNTRRLVIEIRLKIAEKNK